MCPHLDVHVVCDNYGTHKHPTVKTWLTKHPRFHMHFTPTYSSWINQVERLFAEVTRDLLQRSDHRSVQALEKEPGGSARRSSGQTSALKEPAVTQAQPPPQASTGAGSVSVSCAVGSL